MALHSLESRGLIEKAEYNAKQVQSNISRAHRDIVTARETLTIDEEWAYTIAYHAMLRVGRALMFAYGTRLK